MEIHPMSISPIRFAPMPAVTFGSNQPPKKPDSQAHFEELESRIAPAPPTNARKAAVNNDSWFKKLFWNPFAGILAGAAIVLGHNAYQNNYGVLDNCVDGLYQAQRSNEALVRRANKDKITLITTPPTCQPKTTN
jgi:hypothetical protein